MKNAYIHEIDLNLDIDYLRNLISRDISSPNKYAHHRIVSNDEYLNSIRTKYPFLSPVYNVYNFVSKRVVPTHIDGDRLCAINIPIHNTENSSTIFYDSVHDSELMYDEKRILYYLNSSNTIERFRFTLTKPTIINTAIPHSVINYGDETRTIISWSVLKPVTFDECSSYFNDDAVNDITL